MPIHEPPCYSFIISPSLLNSLLTLHHIPPMSFLKLSYPNLLGSVNARIEIILSHLGIVILFGLGNFCRMPLPQKKRKRFPPSLAFSLFFWGGMGMLYVFSYITYRATRLIDDLAASKSFFLRHICRTASLSEDQWARRRNKISVGSSCTSHSGVLRYGFHQQG